MLFEVPTALALLALPVLVLLVALVPRRPLRAETGALELWRRVAEESPRGGTRRAWAPPLWLLAVVLGLVAWAFALAAPRSAVRGAERWHVLVDRRPHMLLEVAPGTTRLAAVLELVRSTLARERGDVDVLWSSPGLDDVATSVDEPFPLAHFLAAAPADRAPDFAAHDAPGTVFATSTVEGLVALRAGTAQSGGPSVPGLVALGPDGALHWDGSAFATLPAPGRAGCIAVDAAAPALLREFMASYAVARGLDLVARAPEAGGAEGPVRLVIGAEPGVGDDLAGAVVAAGDRPLARLESGAELAPHAGGVVALEALAPGSARRPIATVEPGRLRVATGEWIELDPTEFALGLGELLDEALAPDARFVPVSGRRAQGEPTCTLGTPPAPREAALHLRAPLALFAAASFALAAWLRRR
jgi:hypothetical protein